MAVVRVSSISATRLVVWVHGTGCGVCGINQRHQNVEIGSLMVDQSSVDPPLTSVTRRTDGTCAVPLETLLKLRHT